MVGAAPNTRHTRSREIVNGNVTDSSDRSTIDPSTALWGSRKIEREKEKETKTGKGSGFDQTFSKVRTEEEVHSELALPRPTTQQVDLYTVGSRGNAR